MEELGINTNFLLIQLSAIAALLVLPVASLFDAVRKNLNGLSLIVWVLLICMIPVIGSLAYWTFAPKEIIRCE